ncbi:MAG: phage tail protein [Bacilli bacterium]
MAYLGIDPSLRAFKQSMFRAAGGETTLPITVDVETLLVKNGSMLVPDTDYYINSQNKIVVNTPAVNGDEYFVLNLSTFSFSGMASKQDLDNLEGKLAKPLFSVEWWPKRSTVPSGLIPADGQLLTRSTYPDAFIGIQGALVPTVSDADWLSTPAKRASYTMGSDSTNFRIPDYNGKSDGAIGSMVLRGDGKNAASEGTIQGDAIRNLNGAFSIGTGVGVSVAAGYEDGVFKKGTKTYPNLPATETSSSNPTYAMTFDAGRTVPTAEENRMINAAGCWCIRLFHGVVNTGVANFGQAVTDIEKLKSDVNSLNTKIPMNKWYNANTPEFLSRFEGINGWSITTSDGMMQETEHQIHLKCIIRRSSTSTVRDILKIKNPTNDYLMSPYTPIISSLGNTGGGFQSNYIEAVRSSSSEVLLTGPSGITAWIMIDMTIAKNPGGI